MRALGEIASFIGGEMRGDGSICVARVVHPAVAQGAADLAFVLSQKEASVLSSGTVVNAVVPAGIENLPALDEFDAESHGSVPSAGC